MAPFSSQGPAYDNRKGIDVAAPGFFIVSANSSPTGQRTCMFFQCLTCEATRMAGTSMATPVTAGNVALVRQYFSDGYYVCFIFFFNFLSTFFSYEILYLTIFFFFFEIFFQN
eukprot:GSMAST32.ASY1.ANO1.493.1 assembled CDS